MMQEMSLEEYAYHYDRACNDDMHVPDDHDVEEEPKGRVHTWRCQLGLANDGDCTCFGFPPAETTETGMNEEQLAIMNEWFPF
jgi:hypothetical protein